MVIQWFHLLVLRQYGGVPLNEFVKNNKVSKKIDENNLEEQEMVVEKLFL